MMKSYRPNDAGTDAASDIQSIPTEQLDVWSFGDQSEESDDGGWPTFDEDSSSARRTPRNMEVCIQCVAYHIYSNYCRRVFHRDLNVQILILSYCVVIIYVVDFYT